MSRRRHRDITGPVKPTVPMTAEQIMETMRWAGFTAHDTAKLLVLLGFGAPR